MLKRDHKLYWISDTEYMWGVSKVSVDSALRHSQWCTAETSEQERLVFLNN